ncbi:NUDIX hydrolase [Candidatus Gracilibacteria bacterium]|nr:MAG: NUDIX hydrolase [Candidatus Gracilibacteria bacterium]
MTDKFKTNRNKNFNFTFKKLNFDFPENKVTSVAGVVFDDNGKILVVKLDRGFDLPGGHIKNGETVFEAIKREFLEEAFVEITDLKLSSIIESDYFGAEKENLTYMLIFNGKLKTILDFKKNIESKKRVFIYPDDFLKLYSGEKTLMEKIIFNALNSN